MRLWSPSELRRGVKDWEEITPAPLRKAVGALRRSFAESAWKAGEIMRQGCHPALHRGSTDQARAIHERVKKLGYPALPTVAQGQPEPMVFTAHFDCCTYLLAREVRKTFSELFDIASAQSSLLSADPVNWARLETKVLVADESHRIALWTKDTCDVQPHEPSGDSDELIYWTKWRAPKWFFMKPFANRPYDRSAAWERIDENESKHLLEVVEDRFNQRLITALDRAVDETHVRLAKQASQSMPFATDVGAALEVPAQSTSKGEQGNVPRSKADVWREFHDEFTSLAEEERSILRGAREDRRLRVHCSYNSDMTTIERGLVQEGLVCLLYRIESGAWDISDGPSEGVKARFLAQATRAGKELGHPSGTSALDFWLHSLCLDLRRTDSRKLFAPGDTGAIIKEVCEASATFCSRLEKDAVEAPASALAERANRETLIPFIEDAGGRSSSQNTSEYGASYSQARTKTLERKLEKIDQRLQYIKEKFPDWQAFESGYGPGNQAPKYFTEIQRLEKDRENIVLELSKRVTPEARPALTKPKASPVKRLTATITSPNAARKMENHLETKGIGLTQFAVQAGTTDRTLRAFRKTGKVRRDIFESIAGAMGVTKESLLKPR